MSLALPAAMAPALAMVQKSATPFDTNATQTAVYTPTPDDDLFVFISEQYAQPNSPMWNSSTFYHGITNGADWYTVNGGMQDWDYRYLGCNEVTIELGNQKQPAASQLPQVRSTLLCFDRRK